MQKTSIPRQDSITNRAPFNMFRADSIYFDAVHDGDQLVVQSIDKTFSSIQSLSERNFDYFFIHKNNTKNEFEIRRYST